MVRLTTSVARVECCAMVWLLLYLHLHSGMRREAVETALKSIAADDKNFETHKNAAITKGKLLDHVSVFRTSAAMAVLGFSSAVLRGAGQLKQCWEHRRVSTRWCS